MNKRLGLPPSTRIQDFSHERGTTGDSQFKGTKGTKGVQLATASSKVSNMCRGDAPVLAQRYKKREEGRSKRGEGKSEKP